MPLTLVPSAVHGKCHYVSAKRYHGFNSFMSAEQLENPASALLDASHHLKIVLSITQKDQKVPLASLGSAPCTMTMHALSPASVLWAF